MALLKIVEASRKGRGRTIASLTDVRHAEDIPQKLFGGDLAPRLRSGEAHRLTIHYYPGRRGARPVGADGKRLRGHLEGSGAVVYTVPVGRNGGCLGIPARNGSYVAFVEVSPEGKLAVSRKEV